MVRAFKLSPAAGVPQAATEDALRTILPTLIQETLDWEFATFVGAERCEPTAERCSSATLPFR